jgi:uncharacterized protein (UPF0218 family)
MIPFVDNESTGENDIVSLAYLLISVISVEAEILYTTPEVGVIERPVDRVATG